MQGVPHWWGMAPALNVFFLKLYSYTEHEAHKWKQSLIDAIILMFIAQRFIMDALLLVTDRNCGV